MKENINALDEINKGVTMGMSAIDIILPRIKNNHFKSLVKKQYKDYEKISKKIEKIYNKYDDTKEPHKVGVIAKTMTAYGVDMKTIMDDSDSKIAELLIKGTNMGIIEGKRIYNNKKMDDKVLKIVDTYINMQECIVEDLKEFL